VEEGQFTAETPRTREEEKRGFASVVELALVVVVRSLGDGCAELGAFFPVPLGVLGVSAVIPRPFFVSFVSSWPFVPSCS
jgi:hypothetical protein